MSCLGQNRPHRRDESYSVRHSLSRPWTPRSRLFLRILSRFVIENEKFELDPVKGIVGQGKGRYSFTTVKYRGLLPH
jgi:hypothetical protein